MLAKYIRGGLVRRIEEWLGDLRHERLIDGMRKAGAPEG
jgi:hypothetical protein